jgi:prevent-host-death family protein
MGVVKQAVKTPAKTRIVNATEFKAKCLAILDEVDDNGGTVTITKRGRPVAVLAPAKPQPAIKSSMGAWIGKVKLPKNWEKVELRWNCASDITDRDS